MSLVLKITEKLLSIPRDPERKKVEIKLMNLRNFTYLGTQNREDAKTDKELD